MQNLIEKLGLGESAGSVVLWVGLSILLLVVVLALATWIVRTIRPSLNIGGQARGGRPQRLAITDAFALDREGRRLVIIRRDNVEHLLLIGGPNDVLVEGNILRGERSARERAPRQVTEADALQAAEAAFTVELPRPDAAPTSVVVPPAAPVLPAPFQPAPRPVSPSPPSAPPPPASSAAVISVPQPPPVARPATRLDDDFERALSAMQPPPQPVAPPAARPTIAPPPPATQPSLAPAMPFPPAKTAPPAPLAPPVPPPNPPRGEPMSEMARRLSEVLQRPAAGGTLRQPFSRPIPPVPPVSSSPGAKPVPVQPPAPPAAPAAAPPPAPVPEPPPSTPASSEMDMLEEEMARLLGRPGQAPKSTPP